MLQPKFTLSWEGYQRNICNGLGRFQQNEDFVDMTLAADGHFVKVHQIIISLVSPYLKELIKSAQCPHPVIFLNKMSYETLCSILEYIYTGEVTVDKESLEEFAEAGRELRIKGLDSIGTSTSMSRLPLPTKPNDTSTLQEIKPDDRTHSDHEVYIKDVDVDDIILDDRHEDPIKEDANISLDDIGSTSIHLGEPATVKKIMIENLAPNDLLSNNPTIQYTVSNQGNLQMILNRFIYYLRYKRINTTTATRRMWRCVDYIKLRCPASVITKGNIVVDRTSAHTHPFHDKRIAKKVMQRAVFSALVEAEQKGDILKSKKTDSVS